MVGRSSCPDCGTILRIRDRSFVGRRVSCPECKTTLIIDSVDHVGDYVTRRMEPKDLERFDKKHQGIKLDRSSDIPSTTSQRSLISRWMSSPLTAAWLLAIAVVCLIGVLTLAPRVRFTSSRPARVRVEPASSVKEIPGPETRTMEPPETPEPSQIKLPTTTVIDESAVISALQPANLDGPMNWPPVSSLIEAMPDRPVDPPPAPVKIDVKSKLSQKFSKYSQPKVRRRELIEALQEQLGASIRYDSQDLGLTELDETVSFELGETTVGDVIKVVADAARWDIAIEDTGIRLTKKRSLRDSDEK